MLFIDGYSDGFSDGKSDWKSNGASVNGKAITGYLDGVSMEKP